MSSARIAGAATSTAETNIVLTEASAADASELICGALTSGISVNVRASPRRSQASPPIAMNSITPTSP